MKTGVPLWVFLLLLNLTVSAQQPGPVFSGREILDAPFVGLKTISVSVDVPDAAGLGPRRPAVVSDNALPQPIASTR